MTEIINETTAYEEKPEYWDLFDLNGNFVRKMRKGEGYVPPELYHITIEVIATDFKGHLLTTRRSLNKRRDAGCWEFPAGSVISGEKPHYAALRELVEETGLKPQKLRVFHKARVPGMLRIAYFAYVPDLLTAPIMLQPGETMDYRIVTLSQWYAMLTEGLFARSRMRNYTEHFFKAIEEHVGDIPDEPTGTTEKKTIRKVNFGEE